MTVIYINGVSAAVRSRESITSGSVGIYQCQFLFSSDWEGLDKTAVFRSGLTKVEAIPDASGLVAIPWEVLAEQGNYLYAGILGTRGEEIVKPTVWAKLGVILRGTSSGSQPQPPPTDVYAQILAAANEAKAIAQSVRNDLENLNPTHPPSESVNFPAGGHTGQVLAKRSDADGDFYWKDPITYAEVSNESGGTTVTILGV